MNDGEKAFWGSSRADPDKPAPIPAETPERPARPKPRPPVLPVPARPRDISTAGARLAAMRRQVTHLCQQCQEPFTGIMQAKYCSNACRQRAKYARR